jgi:dephospho-CoA kinase
MVCKIIEQLGYYVFYADTEAHKIYNQEDVKKILIDKYGGDIYQNNQLNKPKLGTIIFNNPQELSFINGLIHPRVKDAFEKKMIEHHSQNFIFKEAAILFESGTYTQCDKIILVTAPEIIRIERVMKRDNISEEEVKKRIEKQWSDEAKIEKSNFVIINDGEQSIIKQVINILKNL